MINQIADWFYWMLFWLTNLLPYILTGIVSAILLLVIYKQFRKYGWL